MDQMELDILTLCFSNTINSIPYYCPVIPCNKHRSVYPLAKNMNFTQSEPVGDEDERVQIFSPSRAWTITWTV